MHAIAGRWSSASLRAQLVDRRRAFADQTVAGTVQCLHVELIVAVELDEAHRRSACRLDDRLRIPVVVLLRLGTGAHVFGRHQAHGVSLDS
jgi:hypothetical protein